MPKLWFGSVKLSRASIWRRAITSILGCRVLNRSHWKSRNAIQQRMISVGLKCCGLCWSTNGVLDFGCGNGGFLKRAKLLVAGVTGIELEDRVREQLSGQIQIYSELGALGGWVVMIWLRLFMSWSIWWTHEISCVSSKNTLHPTAWL